MPLVSVIVAIYNIETYIEACIQSLLKQTYQNIEILLIDDGSTDRSGEICDKYAGLDSRIRVIHKRNGGLSDVRNVGIEAADGTYMMYVDGDDTVSENFVKKAMNCAEENHADVVIFDFWEIEEDTGRKDRWRMSMPRNKVLSASEMPFLIMTTPCAWNKIYRTEWIKNLKIKYPLKRHYEDLTVTPCLLAEANNVVYLDSEPLYNYMLRDGSIMRSRNFEKNFNDRTAAINDIHKYFEEHKLEKKYQKELEYLTFEHTYFMPVKEILMYEPRSIYKDKFYQYTFQKYPDILNNSYISEWLSNKDRLQLFFMKQKAYWAIRLLSKVRKQIDKLRGGANE